MGDRALLISSWREEEVSIKQKPSPLQVLPLLDMPRIYVQGFPCGRGRPPQARQRHHMARI